MSKKNAGPDRGQERAGGCRKVPGDVLRKEYLEPSGLSINALARLLDVPPGRICEILNGKRAITADTALRLGLLFGVKPEMWMRLQYDYELALRRASIQKDLDAIIPYRRRS